MDMKNIFGKNPEWLKENWKGLLVSVAIPLAVGGLASFFTRDAMQNFEVLKKPPLSPPGWIFPVVWTILYLLMGVAAFLIAQQRGKNPAVASALGVYAFQLLLNFFWPIIFFNREWYFAAFVLLIVLWAMIWYTILAFYPINKCAAYLLVPYVLWVTFAGYLNLGVALLQ